MKVKYIIIPLSILLLSGCSRDDNHHRAPQESTYLELYQKNDDSSLRALGDDGTTMLLSCLDEGGTPTITPAELRGGKWILREEKEITGKGRFFGLCPSGDMTVNEYGAVKLTVDAAQNKEMLYATAEYSPGNSRFELSFKHIQSRFRILFDLSDYHGARDVKAITLHGVPNTAYVKMGSGQITRVENYSPIKYVINKHVDSTYQYEFGTFPGDDNVAPSMSLEIDNRRYSVSLMRAGREKWSAGQVYTYKVKISDHTELVDAVLSNDRQNDSIERMPDLDAPYFRASITNLKWKIFPRNHATLIGAFIDNSTGEDFVGDIRLVLESLDGRVVRQGVYWSNHKIRAFAYEGLRIPFMATVPPGQYRLRVLLRKAGDKQWFSPFTADDSDKEDDWIVEVRDQPNVYLTYLNLGRGYTGEASVTQLKSRKPYNFRIKYNSYEDTDKDATIRVYYERNPSLNGHSAYLDENGTVDTWSDLLTTKRVQIKARAQGEVTIPYVIRTAHPNYRRYAGYLYATIQYDGGAEYPLRIDANAIYNQSLKLTDVLGDGPTLAKLTNSFSGTNAGTVIVQ